MKPITEYELFNFSRHSKSFQLRAYKKIDFFLTLICFFVIVLIALSVLDSYFLSQSVSASDCSVLEAE